ncbi:MAG: hypothetical protein QXK06_00845 [Candidatus Diapherotrites archaeon]
MAIRLFELLKRLFGIKKAEQIAREAEKHPPTAVEKWRESKGGEFLKMEKHKGWFDGKAEHQLAAKKAWHKRLEHKLDEIAAKKEKTPADRKAIKEIEEKLVSLEKEIIKMEREESKKKGLPKERKLRRKKIRAKLEGKKPLKPKTKKTRKAEKEKEAKPVEAEKTPETTEPVVGSKESTPEVKPLEEPQKNTSLETPSAIETKPQDKESALIERSLWAKQRAEKAAMEEMQRERLKEIIKEKSGEGTPEEKIEVAERRIQELMQKYHLSEKQIESELEKLDSRRLLQDFDRLINLIEADRRERRIIIEESPEMIDTAMPYLDHKKEKTKTIAKEIKKHRIVTDADRIYAYVKEKGHAKSKQLSKELGIPGKKVDEYAEILAENGLVELKYLPLGGILIKLKEEKKAKK